MHHVDARVSDCCLFIVLARDTRESECARPRACARAARSRVTARSQAVSQGPPACRWDGRWSTGCTRSTPHHRCAQRTRTSRLVHSRNRVRRARGHATRARTGSPDRTTQHSRHALPCSCSITHLSTHTQRQHVVCTQRSRGHHDGNHQAFYLNLCSVHYMFSWARDAWVGRVLGILVSIIPLSSPRHSSPRGSP